MAQFGDLLAELRQDRGLTQSELGRDHPKLCVNLRCGVE